MQIEILAINENYEVQLPSSKSLSNRALMIRALCNETFEIENLSSALDTRMFAAMLSDTNMVLNAHEAGTALRFGVTLFAIRNAGTCKIITGAPALRKRPIANLVESLQSIGADITYADQQGFAPLVINSKSLKGGLIKIQAGISSQFVSALCMIAPCLEQGLQIQLEGDIVSEPYIKMTLALMQYFGVSHQLDDKTIIITHQQYSAKKYVVESDWSSACFMYALAILLKDKKIIIDNIIAQSLQGDAAICSIAKDFGIATQFENNKAVLLPTGIVEPHPIYNFCNYPDLAIPMIVVCAIAFPMIQLTGLQTLKDKESNRIEALQIELAKVGLVLSYENDILSFSGNLQSNDVVFESWNDHRIAMALSLISVFQKVTINNHEVVQKSFPNYWEEMKGLGAITNP